MHFMGQCSEKPMAVWDRSDAAPWPSTGTQEVSADRWCGIWVLKSMELPRLVDADGDGQISLAEFKVDLT